MFEGFRVAVFEQAAIGTFRGGLFAPVWLEWFFFRHHILHYLVFMAVNQVAGSRLTWL
jgi:hypothetical protein